MVDRVGEVLSQLYALRQQNPSEQGGDYWPSFVRLLSELCVAERVAVVSVSSNRAQMVASHSTDQKTSAWPLDQDIVAEPLLDKARTQGFAIEPQLKGGSPCVYLVVPLAGLDHGFLYLELVGPQVARANELLLRARLVADTGAQATTVLSESPTTDPLFQNYLELAAQLHTHSRFSTACYALVNGLVGCDEAIDLVAVGWREGGYIKLKGLSHHDRFERRTEWVKRLEGCLEEAADQDQSILYPDSNAGGDCIDRAHQQLLTATGCQQIITVTSGDMAEDGECVLLALSYETALERTRLKRMKVLLELAYPVLNRLKAEEAPPVERAWGWTRKRLEWLVGSDRLVLKSLGLVMSIAIVYGIFGTLPHRIEGSAELVTDQTRLYAAPFEGRIEAAFYSPGQQVEVGDVLAQMDVQDFLLQRGELQADLRRQTSEARRARARGDLVEAEIASARVEQLLARLARVEARLDEAQVTSDFSGIVVEGEVQNLLGLPVRQGDPLYRLAHLEALYLQIDVAEHQAHFITPGQTGEFVFVSRPTEKLPLRVTRVVPMAHVEPGQGAFFKVIAEPLEPAATWWRPGMQGVAKIDQGNRSVFWVIGHELMNRLRIWLWW